MITPHYFAIGHNIDVMNPHTLFRDRTARIFVEQDNHMHNTPVQEKGCSWVVQFERQGVYKTPGMGW